MARPRAVGTLTLGVALVIFGVFFLANTIIGSMPYEFIFMLWPAVLILLGAEVLLAHALNREEKAKFSGVSIFLLALLVVFALGMGTIGYVLQNSKRLLEISRML